MTKTRVTSSSRQYFFQKKNLPELQSHVYDLYIHLVYKETGITELSCYTVIGAYTTLSF